MADGSDPGDSKVVGDSNMEIDWPTLSGQYAAAYLDILIDRCERSGIEPSMEVVNRLLRLHVHRGLSMLTAGRAIRKLDDLFSTVTSLDTPSN